jgi:hypothetical protein
VPPNCKFGQKLLIVDNLEGPHGRKTVNALTIFNVSDRGPTRDRPQKVSPQSEAWFARDGKKTVPPNCKFGQKRLNVDNLKAPHVRKTVNTLTKLKPTDRGQTIDRLQKVSTQNEAWFTLDAKKTVPKTAILSKND